jgi:hypothetical protein
MVSNVPLEPTCSEYARTLFTLDHLIFSSLKSQGLTSPEWLMYRFQMSLQTCLYTFLTSPMCDTCRLLAKRN